MVHKMTRQIKLIIDLHFVNNTTRVGSDSALLELQLLIMSQVMEKVLMNVKGKKPNQSYRDCPQTLLKLHQEHQTSSETAQSITVNLSNQLSTLTIATATSRCDFLEEFDSTIEKYDQVSIDKMHSSHKIGLL